METTWFALLALMLAMYVVFDGFDLGAGAVQPWIAGNANERGQVIRSIGPVWDGNEVWLLASGGTLYFAFPTLYASSFSGFYLPLMIVLWLLILRGIAVEFRNHLEGAVWQQLWDAVFAGASLLLALFFGAALGNVVRGVPLGEDGYFFAPLWTDFGVTGAVGVLDWYTLPVGLTALVALAVHGSLWVALKTECRLQRNAWQLVGWAWWVQGLLTAAITYLTWQVQPQLAHNLVHRPIGAIFPLTAVAGWVAIRVFAAKRKELPAFLASTAYLIGMLLSAAYGIYPYVLPSNVDPAMALTVTNAAAAPYGLKVGLAWWIPGMLLVTAYFVHTYWRFGGKIDPDATGH